MNAWYDYALGWFADYYLLSTLLLTVVLVAGSLMQQPARRLVLAWATVGGLALLGVLLAVPGWSVVHLLGDAPPKPDWVVLEEEPAAGLSETPVVKVNPLEGESYYVQPAAPVAEEPAPSESGGVTQTQVVAEVHEVNLSPYFLAPLIAGCIIVLAWLILGGWQTYRMVRSSDPSPPEVESLLSALCDAGDRRPHLRLSHWVATGVALGLLRPMILLPQQYADRQDAEGLRLVLAHELAHLRRGDLWMLAAIRGLMIVLWAHPLYWLFRRRVRLDQETLADAAAAALTSRTSYAAQLVGWARQLDSVRPPSLAGAVGLWETKSQLRKRITVLLDERLTILRDCSRKWKLAALVLCGTVALGLSLMTVEPGKANAEEVNASLAEETSSGEADTNEEPSGKPTNEKGVLEGRVVDQEGNPVSGAEVGLVIGNSNPGDDEHLVTTVLTNSQGYYALPLEGNQLREVGSLWTRAPRYSPTRDNGVWVLGALDNKQDFELVLPRAEATEFVLLDADQNPVPDATLRIEHIRVSRGVGYQLPDGWNADYQATSDANGRLQVPNMLPDTVNSVTIETQGVGRLRYDQNYFLNEHPAGAAPHYRMCVPQVATLAGSVISDADDAPLQTPIAFTSEVRPPWGASVGVWGLADATPDDEGKFEVLKIASGDVHAEWQGDASQPWRAMTGAPQRIEPGGFANFAVKVVRGVEVRGRVVKSETGEGYPNFRLTLVHGPTERESKHGNSAEWLKVETDEQGWYSAILPPGYLRLRINSAPHDYRSDEWWKPEAESLNRTPRRIPTGTETFDMPPLQLVPAVRIAGKLVDKNDRPLNGWSVYGYPSDAKDVMNSFPGVDIRRDGKFEGYVPKTQVPTIWKVSCREWTNEYNFEDQKYTPKIVSENPLVLQVDVDGRTKEEQKAERDETEPATDAEEDTAEESKTDAPTEGTLEAGAGTLTLAGGQTGQGTKNFRFEAQKTPNLVEGVCLAPDGKPANGVTVTLYRSRQLANNFTQLATATTGLAGRFEFADVLPKDEVATAEKDWREAASRNENEVFWLVTQKPGFVTRYASAAKPALAAGVNARVTLEPSATLIGTITDPDGKPIEGAQVRVSRGATTPLPPGIHNAVTDAKGRYSIDDAAPFDRQEYEKLLAARGDEIYSLSFWAAAEPSVGESEEILPPVLSVSHPDFALKRVAYDAIPGTKDVQLEVASQIEGRVQQVNGEPLANGRVRAISSLREGPDPTYEQFVLTAPTGSDGSYQFDQVPAGEYDIQLMVPHTEMPDALPRPLSGVNVGPDQRVQAPDLRMERGGLVEVQLVDTETKKPISLTPGADAYVQIEHLKSGRFDRHRGFRMPVGQDAKFTVRCLPGKTSISVLQAGTPYDDETGASPEWSDANENAKEVDVLEGGTITVDVEMKNQEARNKLGAIGLEATKLAGDGKPFEAAEKMSEAVDLFNGDELTSALVMRGRYWLQAEEYGKAIADYEQVLSMDPTPRAASYVRAQLIMLLVNCKDESFRDYDRAIEEGASAIGDTKSLELVRPLYSALAKAYEATGQPDEAIALRERLSKVEDGAVGQSNLQRLLERARELEQKRDFAGQVNLYEQIIADGEASGTTYEAIAKNNLAYLFAAAPAASFRDGKRAVKLVTEAIELFGQPTAQLYDTLAAAYAEAGDFENAIATEQKALELATPAEKPNMQQRLELYKAGKPYRMEQVPAASSKATQPSPTEATQVREEPPRTDFTIVIAKHMMLLDGKEFITWQELEDRIAKLPDPSKARLHYRITHAAMESARELQQAEHRRLEETFKFNGYSIGGFSLRGSHRFDQMETVADLVPNPEHACVGQVVDSDGNPVAGAEVIFAPPVDESLAYRGRDVYLEDGKLRSHLDDVVVVSDDEGRFTVYPANEKVKYYLIAVDPEHGFALVTRQGREAGEAIQLQRWASINSTILPAEGMEQSASVSTSIAEKDGLPDLSINIHVPDRRPQPKAGEFNFPCVPPNMACYYRRGIKRPQGVTISLPTKELTLNPGEVHEITLGGLTPDEADRLEMHEKLFEDLRGAREEQ